MKNRTVMTMSMALMSTVLCTLYAWSAPVAVGAQEAAAAAQPFEMKIATVAPEGTPWEKQLRALKTHIEGNSAGRIKVRLFMGGSLGGEKAIARRVVSGNVQCYGGSTAALGSIVPEMNLVEAPYLFDNFDQADHALDGAAKPLVTAALSKRGFAFGAWAENGFRSWFTRDRAIRTPADLRGLRMRSQEARVSLATYEAFGATPNPIDMTNVLTSLQTGVVDGFDNTPLFAFATSWYQAVHHLHLSEHSYQPGIVVFSQVWLDTLPADLRTMLLTLPPNITTDGRSSVRRMDPILIQNLQRAGIAVHRPSAAERAPFIAIGRPVQDRVAGSSGPGGRALLKALRAH